MADESKGNKVVIELDIDSKNFDAKVNGVSQQLGNLGQSGHQSFTGLEAATIAWNEGLELVHKGVEAIHAVIEKIEITEKFNNQKRALESMANSINVNATSVMEAVKRASQGTVSDVDAMAIAFRTLNAGIKADMIPTIVELANRYSDSGRVAKSTRDIVEDFAYALEISNTKMLKGYGISSVSSSRQNVFNTMVKDGRQELEKFGDQFDNTGGRLSALWSNITHAFGQGSGKIVSDVVDTSTRTEKLTKEVESLEGAVKAINNNKGIELVKFLREHNYEEGLTNAELLKKVEEDLANTRKALVEQKKEELKVEEQYQEEAKKGGQVIKNLTADEIRRIELSASVRISEKRIAQEKQAEGRATLKSIGEYRAARKAQIDAEADDERETARSRKSTRSQLMGELIAIEEHRRKKIDEIYQQEETTKEIRRDTELKFIQQHATQIQDAYSRVINVQTQLENEKYERDVALLAKEENDKDVYRQKLEQAEMAHQQRLLDIKNQYAAISTQNLSAGFKAGLAQLNNQYGSFSKMVQSVTVKTHGIVSNSFVQMAKGHKVTMEQMLNQFLEMIGTEMINQGTLYVFEGIATGNGSMAATGAAEIAAGMALVSTASANAPAETGGGGGGWGDSGTSAPGMADQKQLERKSAQIIIQGDYLNSRETANHLAEVLRQNSDVTDYAIVAQGKQYA